MSGSTSPPSSASSPDVADAATPGRGNQRLRTRKALLAAAARLMEGGRTPGFEEIAEEALVSRATAYRYFSGLDAVLTEAALDVAVPDADRLFAGVSPDDAVARMLRVDAAFEEMILANEPALRMMLVNALQHGLRPGAPAGVPARQNRRGPLIEAALEPLRGTLPAETFERLVRALALVIGTEARLVLKDVVQADDEEARQVRRWTIEALVRAALTR